MEKDCHYLPLLANEEEEDKDDNGDNFTKGKDHVVSVKMFNVPTYFLVI